MVEQSTLLQLTFTYIFYIHAFPLHRYTLEGYYLANCQLLQHFITAQICTTVQAWIWEVWSRVKKDPWPLIRVRLWGRSYRFPCQYSETRTQLFKNFWLLVLVCIPLVLKDFKIFEWVLDYLPGRCDLCFPLSLWHLTSVSCESWPILQADPPVHISAENRRAW